MSEESPRLTAAVVIPCLDEEASIGLLVGDVRAVMDDPTLPVEIVRILVVDNGSIDRTADVARESGADVVPEPRKGYGRACLTGVLAAGDVDLIVLMDGDRSDVPAELPLLLAPLLAGDTDLVLGSRTMGTVEAGALTPQQIFGNRVATVLFRFVYRVGITDIGPFRVIRRRDLLHLGMREMTYGWSIEMIGRGVRNGLRVQEVPVTYRKRAGGVSKVGGNLRASLRIGGRILGAILRARSDRAPLPADLQAALESERAER